MNIFRERLKEGISLKKLSQSKFATILGVKPQSLNEWFTGKSVPSLKRFKQICEVLEMDANYLLGIPEQRKGNTYNNNGIHNGDVNF